MISISGGYVQPFLGTATGTQRTTAGFYTETITVTGNSLFQFYSNANCVIEVFTIQNTFIDTNDKQTHTIAFSEVLNKWISFRSLVYDKAFSMFINTYSFNNGNMYVHDHQSESRNMFYGVQYPSIIKFVDNKEPLMSKSYLSINYQANQLLITTTDGIQTSLGQVSELIDEDWLKYTLSDGVTQVDVYDQEGIYSASFLRDKNEDIINGTPLKGNYCTIELKTVDNNNPLRLFTVGIVVNVSKVGAR